MAKQRQDKTNTQRRGQWGSVIWLRAQDAAMAGVRLVAVLVGLVVQAVRQALPVL